MGPNVSGQRQSPVAVGTSLLTASADCLCRLPLSLEDGSMPRIQQLPALVISKIAAGEVIERPASVVKELLENSVDAAANRIDVEIEQGGAELIRVVDNGCGILPDDLPLAFASHATSKLASADDLFRIATLGKARGKSSGRMPQP